MRLYQLAVLLPLLMNGVLFSTAGAAPPSEAPIPQNAKWVIHFDLAAIAKTELADSARAERPRLSQLIQRWFQVKFGINPRDDFDSLTLFNDSYEEHEGTLILSANYEIDRVRAALEQDPGITKSTWEDLTLYTFHASRSGWLRAVRGAVNVQPPVDSQPALAPGGEDTAERRATAANERRESNDEMAISLVLLDGKSIVIASSPERAKRAVGLARGDSPILADESLLLSEATEGTLVYGAAIDLQQIQQHQGFFPVLAQHERIYWMLGGSEGQVNAKLVLHTHTEEVAELMEQALAGSIAFGKVWAADSTNLRKLVDSRELSREGKRVELSHHAELETLRAAFGEVRQRFQQRIDVGDRHETGIRLRQR